MPAPVCRVCLNSDVRMVQIHNSQLLEIFERLTCSALYSNDGWPSTMCYICVSQLQRCSRFTEMAHNSATTLTHLLRKGIEVKMTHSGMELLNLRVTHHLTVTDIEHTTHIDEETKVKEEELKEEEQDDWTDESLEVTSQDNKQWPEQSQFDIKNNKYYCNNCGIKCTSEKQIILHLRTHDENTYKCKTCNKVFTHSRTFQRHMMYHSGIMRCDVCDKDYNRNNYKRHMLSHTKEKPYGCDICFVKFSSPAKLKSHKKLAHHLNTYACKLCNVAFNNRNLLREHKLSHVFSCDECSETFNFTYKLNLHKRTKHTKDERYACDRCFKTFFSRTLLYSHMNTHTGERPFICSECNKSFANSGNLSRHKRVHSDKRPYTCKLCTNSFKYSCMLARHMLVHSDVRPFPCNLCDKKFRTSTELKNHLFCHTGEKPFVCETCSASFSRKHHLKEHMVLHIGVKPFACDKCNKAFNFRTNLLQHKCKVT